MANVSLPFTLPIYRILKKIHQKKRGKKQIHDKHKPTHFRAQTPNGIRQKGKFYLSLEKQTSYIP